MNCCQIFNGNEELIKFGKLKRNINFRFSCMHNLCLVERLDGLMPNNTILIFLNEL